MLLYCCLVECSNKLLLQLLLLLTVHYALGSRYTTAIFCNGFTPKVTISIAQDGASETFFNYVLTVPLYISDGVVIRCSRSTHYVFYKTVVRATAANPHVVSHPQNRFNLWGALRIRSNQARSPWKRDLRGIACDASSKQAIIRAFE